MQEPDAWIGKEEHTLSVFELSDSLAWRKKTAHESWRSAHKGIWRMTGNSMSSISPTKVWLL